MIAAVHLVPPGYHSAAPAASALVVVALLAALAGAELCRAHGSPWAERARRRLQAAAVPLLLCSVVVVGARLVPLV
jgi:UPF0716 family protein affecting phage T7 exclusion